MDSNERTKDVFEEISAYPKPPVIPLSDPDDLTELFEAYGIKQRPAAFAIVKTAGFLTGLKKFHKKLPDSLEKILRGTNTRTPGLFAPAISATLALEDDERSLTPVDRASGLICAARSLYNDINSGRLEPDKLHGHPLEMGEYPNLFSTNMIIEGKKVRVFKSRINSKVVVASGGKFFLLNLGDLSGEIPFGSLHKSIAHIVNESSNSKDETLSAGILTAAAYNTQVKAFQALCKDKSNREALNEFRHSFITVCLDLDTCPETYDEAAKIAHSANYFNRWFHSSLQIVVFGNSKACVICNFTTYLDGNVMMRAGAELKIRAQKQSIVYEPESTLLEIKKLRLIPEKKYISLAQSDLKRIQDNQQATFEIKDTGTRFFNLHGLSPVPAFIAALQIALKNLYNDPVQITQFLSMSKYRCMDLTTVKISTPEVMRFVEYMGQPQLNPEIAKILLGKAVDSQITKCREARKHLTIDDILALYIRTRNIAMRLYILLMMFITVRILKLFRLIELKKGRYEVIVSHPEIYPEVKIVGRPGIRLPYVKYFGLHYQIWKDHITLTFMPSAETSLTNEQIISEINKSLMKIRMILETSRLQVPEENKEVYRN